MLVGEIMIVGTSMVPLSFPCTPQLFLVAQMYFFETTSHLEITQFLRFNVCLLPLTPNSMRKDHCIPGAIIGLGT